MGDGVGVKKGHHEKSYYSEKILCFDCTGNFPDCGILLYHCRMLPLGEVG